MAGPVDVTVLGGGVIGLSCAWRMAQRGARVRVYDARGVGGGASGAALGALWPAAPLAKQPHQELQRQSLWRFEAFVRELVQAAGVEIPFRRGGRVELLNSAKLLERSEQQCAAARREWPAFGSGEAVMETVSAADVQAMFPTLASKQHGAIVCRATAQVQVMPLLRALEGACQRAGVEICWNAAQRGLAGEGITLVTAGAWTGRLLPRVEVTPAKGQAIALSAPASLRLEQIVKDGSTYLVPWGKEILVGSTTEPEAGFDEAATAEAGASLHQRAAGMFPELGEAKVLRQWAGLRPDAPNHVPVVGRVPGLAKTYVATGFFKTGIGMSAAIGRLVAGMILEGVVPAELAAFAPAAD